MYDAVIIGSGPGGYHCAVKIAELGGKVAVIEKDKLGGTCTNYGCIPTKALHASSSFLTDISNAKRYGVDIPSYSVDFNGIMTRKNRVVNTILLGVKKLLDDNRVDILYGEAIIKDRNTVLCNNNQIKTKKIVIATGARPRMLKGTEVNDIVLTSKEILELRELPKSLVIIGGGYIGCEFASIFSSFGVKVTIVEMMKSLIFNEDADIVLELTRCMEKKDIEILTETKITGITGNKVFLIENGEEKAIEADKILISIGVSPFFNKEEADKLGIKYSEGILVNSRMQTSVENIYAIGDVTNGPKLAHHAYAQAEVAGNNIMGIDEEFDDALVPSTIFTIPEIASVGVKNSKLKYAVFPFAANGKARSMEQSLGFVKIYHHDRYLKGFCAIGPHVSDIVSEAALAIKNNLSLEQIKKTIHAHPTLPEAFLEAVKIALKQY